MPVDSNGNYSLPPGYLAVTGQTILASQHNPPLQDIAAALSQVLYRSGVAPMNANLNMSGFKVTNAAEGVADGDYVTMSQLAEVIASVTAGTVPTGTVAGFRMTAAPSGWVKENGGTIGSVASGATNRASADTEALFTLLWNNFNQATLPIQNSAGAVTTRGANAAADFAAAKRMPLFDSRSRFLRGADDGLGFDASIIVGLAQDDAIKNHVHPGSTTPTTIDLGGVQPIANAQTGGSAIRLGTGGSTPNIDMPALPFTTSNNTGGNALETRPRSSAVLICIKL